MSSRAYTTRRLGIVEALVNKLKDIDGTGFFLTNLEENVSPRLKFWDEVEEFPAVHLNAGSETREYQAGGFKNRFLSITLRCYVQAEDAVLALDEHISAAEFSFIVQDPSGIIARSSARSRSARRRM